MGPLLFLIFISSIGKLDLINNAILMTFADNMKLLQKINSEDDALDCQSNLDKLFIWEMAVIFITLVKMCEISP